MVQVETPSYLSAVILDVLVSSVANCLGAWVFVLRWVLTLLMCWQPNRWSWSWSLWVGRGVPCSFLAWCVGESVEDWGSHVWAERDPKENDLVVGSWCQGAVLGLRLAMVHGIHVGEVLLSGEVALQSI